MTKKEKVRAMSKDITEDILLRAGFKEDNGYFEYATKVNDFVRIIGVTHDHSLYGRNYAVCVSLVNNDPICYACIQTVEHFNKLMELMDIDFKLKEE